MSKVKLVEITDDEGNIIEEYLPVRLVHMKRMSPEGRKHWNRKCLKKAYIFTFNTLPRTRKLHTYVNNKRELGEWLSLHIDKGMRVQIQRYVHKKGMPRKFAVGKKIAEVELTKNGRLIIFYSKGLNKMSFWKG